MNMKYIGYYINLDLSLLKGEENTESLAFVDKCLKIVPIFNSLSLSFQHCYNWNVKNSEQFRNIYLQMSTIRKVKLQSLSLNLEFNDLECQTLNMMHIFSGIVQLKYLKSLNINLSGNNLGISSNIMLILQKSLEKLLNLNSLCLNFDQNKLGLREENIRKLIEGLKLLKKLHYLNLGLSGNDLGSNGNNIKVLGIAFQELNNSLKLLVLNLDYNQLGGEDNSYVTKCRNIMYLGYEISKLEGLEKLEISLRLNYLWSNTLVGLAHGLKKLINLKSLKIIVEGDNQIDMAKIQQQFSFLKIQELSIE